MFDFRSWLTAKCGAACARPAGGEQRRFSSARTRPPSPLLAPTTIHNRLPRPHDPQLRRRAGRGRADPAGLDHMREIPQELLAGPFIRSQALQAGATKSMLSGRRFTRIHPRVWCHRDHVLSWDDRIRAAQLALPPDARLTHITRLHRLGLDYGPRTPLHFVVEGELHLALEGIFLHRTKSLAPGDDESVLPAAAFIAYCSTARLIDAIKVGDWLLHRHHVTITDLVALALAAPWRDGADEALFVIDWLDDRSRSLKETELRAVLRAGGLPSPEPNHPIALGEDATAIGDLVFVEQGLVIEFQGGHHQEDRTQYVSDIERFQLFLGHDVPYVEVTRETLDRPKTLVGVVFRQLLGLGYDGPAPVFDERWTSLFRPISQLLPPRRARLREIVAGGR